MVINLLPHGMILQVVPWRDRIHNPQPANLPHRNCQQTPPETANPSTAFHVNRETLTFQGPGTNKKGLRDAGCFFLEGPMMMSFMVWKKKHESVMFIYLPNGHVVRKGGVKKYPPKTTLESMHFLGQALTCPPFNGGCHNHLSFNPKKMEKPWITVRDNTWQSLGLILSMVTGWCLRWTPFKITQTWVVLIIFGHSKSDSSHDQFDPPTRGS